MKISLMILTTAVNAAVLELDSSNTAILTANETEAANET